jgi:RND superfamily putative drug exporter
MREEHVHGDDAKLAVHDGFVHSAKVVVAAALIMFAVFAFFVPNGEGALKAIAFGLAIGVLIDAFLVRMTLVPAVMHLLGERAWWLPKWLDKILPSLDIEGESLARQLRLADWPAPGDTSVVYAEDLVIGDRPPLVNGLNVRLEPGQVLAVTGAPAARAALLLALGGRLATSGGQIKVLGHVLPDASAKLRRESYCADALTPDLQRSLARTTAGLILVDDVDRLSAADRAAVAALIPQLGTRALVVGASHLEALTDVLRPGDFTVHLDEAPALVGNQGGTR